MNSLEIAVKRPKNAARWISFGTYYGMFPVDFALNAVERYTAPGDAVLDPFAGRGTAIAAAAALGRRGTGIEINPVGWVYGQVKLKPAPMDLVLSRLEEIGAIEGEYSTEMARLPEFYRWCFDPSIQMFLLAVRHRLNWRNNEVDATLAAFILLYLHGKRGQALSNQMRQQKSMAPDYSVRWWQARNLRPPDIDPVAFLTQRIQWRYKWGTLCLQESQMLLGDSMIALPRLEHESYRLLLTSPPYYDVTSYYYDHWLRYWVLGGPNLPTTIGEEWRRDSRHGNQERYRYLLHMVFTAAARLMRPDGVIYIRTDAREFTLRITSEALQVAFPNKRLEVKLAPYDSATQTALFGDPAPKPGEVDLILT